MSYSVSTALSCCAASGGVWVGTVIFAMVASSGCGVIRAVPRLSANGSCAPVTWGDTPLYRCSHGPSPRVSHAPSGRAAARVRSTVLNVSWRTSYRLCSLSSPMSAGSAWPGHSSR